MDRAGLLAHETDRTELHGEGLPKKRVRKSRGRGLRTKTGCLTCRKRHKKCDELLPVCGPCSIAQRDCVFAEGLRPSLRLRTHSANEINFSSREIPNATPNVCPETSSHIIASPCKLLTHVEEQQPLAIPALTQESYQYGYSPETATSDILSADLASTRWLDLLTTDAAQADGGFTLALSPAPEHTSSTGRYGTFPEAQTQSDTGATVSIGLLAAERPDWQSDRDIILKDREAVLFRSFAETAASWLDLFDPSRHFSTHATRLALRNQGLMKSILALAARHDAMIQTNLGRSGADANEAIQYYYETLHYVQTAIKKYDSYAHSEELLGTAIVISTYEMLDASDSNWKRHLKGVFWIQRSQNVNGASGGLRQSVWWAWLRQDVWAAFRERRRCFSFWRPVNDYSELTQDDLASYSVYLLSQAINYCALPDASSTDPEVIAKRADAGAALLHMIERWKTFQGPKFKPLPTPAASNSVFQPLWIHPPHFAVALQVISFARILVTLHSPAKNGFDGYLNTQRALSDDVATITGVAMELRHKSCQILSAQSLFVAGLCVQDDTRREAIISLIGACEARSNWPMSALRNDLRAEWAKIG
ncbi:hypothetical protein F5B20DRAFT_522227 [Whalleya microplaca]|nr:hypothetical protein F5B20DRAFT_522227 [Whalleya microplaca]